MDSDYSDIEDDGQKGHVELKEGVNLNSLLTGETFEITLSSIDHKEEEYDPRDVDVSDFTGETLDYDSSDDDEDEINSTPFEKLAKKMVDVTDDGKVKKRIIREGRGEIPEDNSVVHIYYTSYLEYSDEPIDCAYSKKPYRFRLGTAGVYGLTIAVKSMKVNEKSHFLVYPEYAFGVLGHPPRIPANATFLFQVELLRTINSGAALQFEKLTMEEKSQFPKAYEIAQGLVANGRDLFKRDVKLATREYNRAVDLLERCSLSDISEQEKQQALLFKIYGNLAVCYNRLNEPRRVCIMCNNIYAMAKNTSLKISAKVYFNNGRALLNLGDLNRARERLYQAKALEPHNPVIFEEIIKLNDKRKKEQNIKLRMASALVKPEDTGLKNGNIDTDKKEDNSFATVIRSMCEDLINKETKMQFKLPSGLTEEEREIVQLEAQKLGLRFRESKNNENDGELAYFVSKTAH